MFPVADVDARIDDRPHGITRPQYPQGPDVRGTAAGSARTFPSPRRARSTRARLPRWSGHPARAARAESRVIDEERAPGDVGDRHVPRIIVPDDDDAIVPRGRQDGRFCTGPLAEDFFAVGTNRTRRNSGRCVSKADSQVLPRPMARTTRAAWFPGASGAAGHRRDRRARSSTGPDPLDPERPFDGRGASRESRARRGPCPDCSRTLGVPLSVGNPALGPGWARRDVLPAERQAS
jgi:hypothetical protein